MTGSEGGPGKRAGREPETAPWSDPYGELLAIVLRPGNAGSNTAADHIAVLRQALAQLPAKYRRKILFRIDGAGFSHELLAWITSADGVRGRRWEYSAGWALTDREEQAIRTLRKEHWQSAVDQDGSVRAEAHVADITGLLDLPEQWPEGIRIIVRRERLHPQYVKQVSAYEKKLGQRFQVIATNTALGQVCDLDARHRDHADVEDGVKTGKDLGLRRLPSADWEINCAWCLVVAIAADLTAWLRLFALDGELAGAEPKALRFRLLHLPARLARHARRRVLHLPEDWPWTQDAVTAWERISALPQPT